MVGEAERKTERFDPTTNGWTGFCNTACWSTKYSIGAGKCTSDDSSASNREGAILSLYFVVIAAALWSIPI
jgi:hypothetical protein